MSPINEWRLSVGSIGIFVNVGTALIYLPEPFIGFFQFKIFFLIF